MSSKTPGLLTPLDEEFDEHLDRPVRVLELRRQVIPSDHHNIPMLTPTVSSIPGAIGHAIGSALSHIPPFSDLHQTASLSSKCKEFITPGPDLEPRLRPKDSIELRYSKITPNQIQELATRHVTLGRVLTLSDGGEYVAWGLTSNLLYAAKAPGVIVIPIEVQEIQNTVDFARNNNIPLTVQNGGHSHAGYSLKYGGILINMAGFGPQYKKIHIDDKDKTVTIPAGYTWSDVYKYFRDNNRSEMVLGGRCRSVGVSGFILGGGVSPLSRQYGLGIDSLKEMKIVTASGNHITVNDKGEDPEMGQLFWALRGGGGGNFGILTEFTTQLQDLANKDGKDVYRELIWDFSKDGKLSEFQGVIKEVDSHSTEWPNAEKLTIDVVWQHNGMLLLVFDGTEDEYNAAVKRLLDFNPEVRGTKQIDWWDVAVTEPGWSSQQPAFHHHTSFVFEKGALTSRLDDSDVTSKVTKLMDEANELIREHDPNGKAYLMWVHIGAKTMNPRPDKGAFPWRNATYVSYFKIQWHHRESTTRMIEFADKVKKSLLPHTIQGKAAYVNFVDRTLPDWQQAYYGDNYPDLQKVKKIWDPTNFFNFEQGIELPGEAASQTSTGGAPNIRDWNEYSLPNPEELWKDGYGKKEAKAVEKIIADQLQKKFYSNLV